MSKHIIKDIDGKGTEIKKEASVGIERVEPSILHHEQRISVLEDDMRFEYEHDSTTGEHPRANNFQDGFLTKEDYIEFSKFKSSVAKRQAIQCCPMSTADYGDPMFAQADFLHAEVLSSSVPLEDFITDQFVFSSSDNGATSVTGSIAGSVMQSAPAAPVNIIDWRSGVPADNKGDTGGFTPGPATSGYLYDDAGCITYLPKAALPSIPTSLNNDGDNGSTSQPYVTTSFTLQMWGWRGSMGGVDILWQMGGYKHDGLSVATNSAGTTPGPLNVGESIWIVGYGRGVQRKGHITKANLDIALGYDYFNRWCLYTFIYDVEDEKMKLYIDKVKAIEIDISDGWRFSMGRFEEYFSGVVTNDPVATINTPTNVDSLVATQEGAATIRPWDGYIQLIRTYDQYVLTPAQIETIYDQDYAKLYTEFGASGDIVISTKNVTVNNPLIVSMAQGFENSLPKNLNKTFSSNINIGTISSADVGANGDGAIYYVYLDYTTGNLQSGYEYNYHPVYEPIEPVWWSAHNDHPVFNTTEMKFYDSTDALGVRQEITRIYLGEIKYRDDGANVWVELISYRPKGEGLLIFNWTTQQGNGGAVVDGYEIIFNHNTGLPWEHLHKTLTFTPGTPYSSSGILGKMIEINPDHNTEGTTFLNPAYTDGNVIRLTEYTLHIEDMGQIVNFYIGGVSQSSYSGRFVYRFSRTW